MQNSPIRKPIHNEEGAAQKKLLKNLALGPDFDVITHKLSPTKTKKVVSGGEKLQIEADEFQKRHLYLLLFRMYDQLPYD